MIDKLGEAIAALLPADLAAELRGNIDALLRSNFEKMNLVTREQLEIQEKVLHRTRARVLELEKQVAELEKLVAPTTTGRAETGEEGKDGADNATP